MATIKSRQLRLFDFDPHTGRVIATYPANREIEPSTCEIEAYGEQRQELITDDDTCSCPCWDAMGTCDHVRGRKA